MASSPQEVSQSNFIGINPEKPQCLTIYDIPFIMVRMRRRAM